MTPVEAYKHHLMWSWRKQYQKVGRNYAYIRTIYVCSGCGFEAYSEDERHNHTVTKILEAKQAVDKQPPG